jgi:ribonuclease P protein component
MHLSPSEATTTRFGFVVSKAVGNAPMRNLIKRRLKALARPLASRVAGDVVFRALPSAQQATWDSLAIDVANCVAKAEKTRA